MLFGCFESKFALFPPVIGIDLSMCECDDVKGAGILCELLI